MIGSHDTFTYLKPINPVFNLFKRWWKCQNKTIDEQYTFGIRFFDIRIVWHKNKWYMAHGLCTLDMHFDSITDICDYMYAACPDAIYRIVLERGNYTIQQLFSAQVPAYIDCKYPMLWRMDIKSTKQWNGVYYNNDFLLNKKLGYKFANVNTWESPSQELHGHITKDNWYKINLKKEAKKINPNLDFFKDKDKLKQMIESKDELYFLDYCTNEY